jgi:mannose-6-phosphate isomerase-like protein (cupin superfamily)
MDIKVVNVKEKFGLFNEQWSPKIIGEMNDSYVKIAKLQGEFVWHLHENEDEMFLIIQGSLTIRLRDRDLLVNAGEFAIIPRGVEHMSVAGEEVQLMMLEPKTTVNTGNVESDRTVEADWI